MKLILDKVSKGTFNLELNVNDFFEDEVSPVVVVHISNYLKKLGYKSLNYNGKLSIEWK